MRKKSQLKVGDKLILRNGERCVVSEDLICLNVYDLKGLYNGCYRLQYYTEDLIRIDKTENEVDVIEVIPKEWIPVNGEEVEVSIISGEWYSGKFIGMDREEYVCFTTKPGGYFRWSKIRRPAIKITEMTIKELEKLTGIENLKIVKEK